MTAPPRPSCLWICVTVDSRQQERCKIQVPQQKSGVGYFAGFLQRQAHYDAEFQEGKVRVIEETFAAANLPDFLSLIRRGRM